MAGPTQEPVTFEDVAVYLSHAEWEATAAAQRELYRSVMMDNYRLLTSLGYPGPKPDILYRLERGEEPWICTAQSPGWWDGPSSRSPGQDRDWLEEPSSGWWPSSGGHHVLEERTQTPYPGARRGQWRLRCTRLLNKLRCGRRSPPEVAGAEVGLVESQEQAQTFSWLGKEEEVTDKPEITADSTQSGGSPPHPGTEPQSTEPDPQGHQRGDPGEGSQRSTPESPCTLGGVTALQGNGEHRSEEALAAVISRDHCYCAAGRTQPPAPSPPPGPLSEHDYSRSTQGGVSTPQDHEYCQLQRTSFQGRIHKMVAQSGRGGAGSHHPAPGRPQIGQILRRAKKIIRCYRLCCGGLGAPQGSCAIGSPHPGVPLAGAGDPTAGAPGTSAKHQVVSPEPPSEGRPQGVTPEAFCPPGGSLVAAPPPSITAMEPPGPAAPPRVCEHRKVQRIQLIRGCRAQESAQRGELLSPRGGVWPHSYGMVLWSLGRALDTARRDREPGGHPCCKGVRPLAVGTDG